MRSPRALGDPPVTVWSADSTYAVVLADRVRYAVPLGRLGELARRAFVRRDLDRVFDHRVHAIAGRLA